MVYDFDSLPDWWKKYINKMGARGWVNPDNGENISQNKANITNTSPLPMSIDDYVALSELLLSLGIADKNPKIAETFFELQRRATYGNRYDVDWSNPDFRKLWNIGMEQFTPKTSHNNNCSFDDRIKADLSNTHPLTSLPIDEAQYIQLAKLLGKLSIKDNTDNEKKDKYALSSSQLFPRLFSHLQTRAKDYNHFNIDAELLEIEAQIYSLLTAEKARE